MNTINLAALLLPLAVVGCSSASEVPARRSNSDAESTAVAASSPAAADAGGLYALSAPDIDGRAQDLSQYAGKVALVVNTASECGYTPQYTGLQKLHSDLSARGFVVLGFPSNDFGGQEPGSADEIKSFCSDKYAVTFPLFAKVVTKAGAEQSPIYGHLGGATGELPKWNFCKYLVDKHGKVLEFYPSKVAPDDAGLRKAIEDALAAD